MEAFEHVTKVWLETVENCAVTSGVKFPVRLRTKKASRDEFQEHGYEIDLVAARSDRLLLVSVKSLLGSKGLSLKGLKEESLFGRKEVLEGVLSGARTRYGYSRSQIQIWLVVGRYFSGDEQAIAQHIDQLSQGLVRMRVVGLNEIVEGVITAAKRKTYLNDPVIVTLKCLMAAGRLKD